MSRRAASAITARSAHLNATAWLAPIGRPKACALVGVGDALLEAALAMPTARAAMATRPSSRMARKLAKPRPRSPSRLASGTRQSVKGRPWVSEACQPILR